MEQQYNPRSPAVKRLMREAAELASPTSDYFAAPLEDNLFEWHFTVRGPEGSEFQEGVYHGRIIVPTEYPMKPPDIILLTPNGRFVVGQKICLSISGYHPETWQPSWSIRTALLAIIGFMPTPGKGTIGSLDYTPQERKVLAHKSINWICDTCGNKPSLLLAAPSQVSTVDQKEVSDIVQSVQLKSEEELKTGKISTENEETRKSSNPNESSSSKPAGQMIEESSGAKSPNPDMDGAKETAVEELPSTEESPREESSGGFNANLQVENQRSVTDTAHHSNSFEVYDVIIFIIVVLIAALIFRRFSTLSSGEIDVDEGAEDLSDLSQ